MKYNDNVLKSGFGELSEDEVNSLVDEFVNSPMIQRRKKVDERIDSITQQELKSWFDNNVIEKLNKNNRGVVQLYSSSEETSIEDEAFAWRLVDDFQKVFNANNWDIRHNIVGSIVNSLYTFDDAVYAFVYKNTEYVLEQMYGQGEQLINITQLDKYREHPTKFDNEVWDYKEIGNFIKVNDNFEILD